MTTKKKERMIPAVPPNDYEGTIAGWIVWLVTNGYMKDEPPYFYMDVMLPESVYDQLLEDCEK